MKAAVNAETCIGCALCTTICPEVFEMDGNGTLAVVKAPTVPQDQQALCRDAADQCPVTAIVLS